MANVRPPSTPPNAPATIRASEQQRIVGRDPAERGRDDEPGVEPEQRAPPVEAVDPERGDEAARRRGERVRRHQEAELLRTDREEPHELRPERHHDHEVDDVRELDGGERQQQRQFARHAGVAAAGGAAARRAGGNADEADDRERDAAATNRRRQRTCSRLI